MEDIVVGPSEAATELLRRQRGREKLIGFTEYTNHKYFADPFHHVLAEALEDVEAGRCDRLMIFAPPRHGKSELSTRRFPAWYLGRNPEKNVISASYNADFATGFGRNVRDIIEDKSYRRLFPTVSVRSDSRAADEWQISVDERKGGTYFAVGVGTGTTGKGAHLFLIDDPIKDRKEADSPSNREGQWDWYRDVVYTRLEEDAAIVLTLTRWHHDDIAGRLIELANSGKGKPWRILTLPALAEPKKHPISGDIILDEEGRVPHDPLLRRPNEPLAPNRFSLEALKDREEVLGGRSWAALYKQKPMPESGGMFQASWFTGENVIGPEALPTRRTKVRAWDFGSTMDGDFSVGVLMSKDQAGVYYIEDVRRFRGSPLEVERQVKQIAIDDGKTVSIRLPQDPGQAGKGQAEAYIRMLAGFKVKAVRPTGSKETRAAAFAAQCEGRNVKLVRKHWNNVFVDELTTFPLGLNDDQVDAASDAFNALVGPQRPAIFDW